MFVFLLLSIVLSIVFQCVSFRLILCCLCLFGSVLIVVVIVLLHVVAVVVVVVMFRLLFLVGFPFQPVSTPTSHWTSHLNSVLDGAPLSLHLLLLLDHLQCSRAKGYIRHIGIGHGVQRQALLAHPLKVRQRRILLLVSEIRIAQLAALLRRYLVAVAQLMDSQCPLQIEDAITELALFARWSGRQCRGALPQTTCPESHLKVIIMGATMSSKQRLNVKDGATRATAIGRLLDAHLAASIGCVAQLTFVFLL